MMTTIGSLFSALGLDAAFSATFALEATASLSEAGLLTEDTNKCQALTGQPGSTLFATPEEARERARHCLCLAPSSGPFTTNKCQALIGLKARFDPAREYTPDEKLEMEIELFDVGDEIYRETGKRLRAYLRGEEDFESVDSWVQEQWKLPGTVHEKLLQDIPPDYDRIFRGLFSSSFQPVAGVGASLLNLRELIFLRTSLEEMAQKVNRYSSQTRELILVDGNGYKISHSRGELAGSFIGNFVFNVQPAWENNRLVVRHPLRKSPMSVTQHATLRAIPWPLDFENLTLKTVLKVLGWKIEQTVDGETVTLRIDFGASTLVISHPSTS